MAPTRKTLKSALIKAVNEGWETNRDELSVKFIRAKVEESLDLEDGFFLGNNWKSESKSVIVTRVEELHDLEHLSVEELEPEVKAQQPKTGIKRSATNNSKTQSKKRQKKTGTPSDDSELSDAPQDAIDDESSALSDMSEDEASKPIKRARAAPKPALRGKGKRKVESDDEDEDEDDGISDDLDDDSSTSPSVASEPEVDNGRPRKAAKKNGQAKKITKETGPPDSGEQAVSSRKTKGKAAEVQKATKQAEALIGSDSDSELSDPKSVITPKAEDQEASESEMSVLLDEEPKPKKSSKAKTSRKQSISKPKAPPKDVTSAEAELKTLQSQLRKCGVTKIWAFELKQFDDDTKAKMRHLREMLRDVGISGRFSNERAAEIKERRELMADVEAINANAESVGAPRQRRSKSKAGQSLREPSIDLGSDEEEEEDVEIVEERAAAAKQDLAFLGSESESD